MRSKKSRRHSRNSAITLLNDSENKLVGKLEESREKYSNQKEINERIDEIIVRINELSANDLL